MSDTARDVVICEPVRTPIGRYGGVFKDLSPVDLGVTALQGLLSRTGIDPERIDDVILGHCYPNAEAPAIGRVVGLDAGLPVTVGGQQVDQSTVQAFHGLRLVPRDPRDPAPAGRRLPRISATADTSGDR